MREPKPAGSSLREGQSGNDNEQTEPRPVVAKRANGARNPAPLRLPLAKEECRWLSSGDERFVGLWTLRKYVYRNELCVDIRALSSRPWDLLVIDESEKREIAYSRERSEF